MEPGNAQLSMTVLMTPDMANFSGNVHGGTLLKYLDEVAYACASRYAGRYVVTLSVDQVIFREPIHVGELVTFLASVNYTGNTSMEVGIKVVTEVHPAAQFFPAEDYHQDYYANNPTQSYCNFVIPPKLAKLKQYFSGFMIEQ